MILGQLVQRKELGEGWVVVHGWVGESGWQQWTNIISEEEAIMFQNLECDMTCNATKHS